MTRYNLQNLYQAKIKKRELLSKEGSVKQTCHIVLDIKGSNITFVPGDCVGIMPQNDPDNVSLCLKYMQAAPSLEIFHKKTLKPFSLKEFLTKKINITRLQPKLLKLFWKKTSSTEKKEQLLALLNNEESLKNYLNNHELWDVLQEFYTPSISPQEICDSLLPLLPRLYSISSAYSVTPEEIHLTVSHLTYQTSNHQRFGVCSHYLCNLAQENIGIFLHQTHRFFLPKDDATPIIMIATGAGIAPFISFLQERYHRKSFFGNNWLFFGECNKAFNFYYEDFLSSLEKENFLKLTTSFSRDQKEKIYVQHRLLENKKEIFSWIKNKASIYLCGDAKKMAKDIDAALITIFQEEENLSEKEAKKRLHSLLEEKRYLKDVY